MKKNLCLILLICCNLGCNQKSSLESKLEGSWSYNLRDLSLYDERSVFEIIGSDSVVVSKFTKTGLYDFYYLDSTLVDSALNHTIGILHFEFQTKESGTVYFFDYDSTKQDDTLELLKIYGRSYSFKKLDDSILGLIDNLENSESITHDTLKVEFDKGDELIINSLTYQKIQIPSLRKR